MPTSVAPSRNSTEPVRVPTDAAGVAVRVTERAATATVSPVAVATFATVAVAIGDVEPVWLLPLGTNVAR